MKPSLLMMTASAIAVLSFDAYGQNSLPRLDAENVKEVISSLTIEEKINIVVGTMRAYEAPPEAAPGMVIRKPSNYLKDLSADPSSEDVNTLISQGKVSGSAGEGHTIRRLGIPGIVYADGPAGLRINPVRKDSQKTYYCTAFPTSSLLAASWDVDLVRAMTSAMGQEVKEYGVDVLLAPAMNIHRNPFCGRNFEYYSEDPVLSGKIAAAFIQGVQSNGVGVSLKHFAVNNQETYRNGIDVHVSDRALREIYLKGFEIAVKEAKPWTVMSSYNKINGILASENKWLLTTLLRDEWGFDGFVMTDWWAEENGARQIAAGNDLLMPGSKHQYEEILDGIASGRLDERYLDKAVENILRITLRTPTYNNYRYSDEPDLAAHARTARLSATEGMVLLKNDGAVLPFSRRTKKVALYGVNAYDILVGGSGSGNVNRAYKVNLNEGMSNAGLRLDPSVESMYREYVRQQKMSIDESFWTVPVIPELELKGDDLQKAALANDVAVLVIGRMAGEGGDRTLTKGDWFLTDVEMKNLEAIADAFHSHGKMVVVVMNMGNIVEMSSWNGIPDAILHSWLPGQEAGNAVADILVGKVNPSGKLPFTVASKYEDYPSASNFPMSNGNPSEVCYDEDIFVGYRHFDSRGVKPLYPFGYGMSYTEFEYSDMRVDPEDDGFKISVTVRNTGKREGKESVQLYSSAPKGRLSKPGKELKAFAKTGTLKPGESETLRMHVSKEELGSWDGFMDRWVCDPGAYSLMVAASSDDVRIVREIIL